MHLNAIDAHVQGSSSAELLQEPAIPPLDVAEEAVDRVDVADGVLLDLLAEPAIGWQEPVLTGSGIVREPLGDTSFNWYPGEILYNYGSIC